jgi:hypothetical protein
MLVVEKIREAGKSFDLISCALELEAAIQRTEDNAAIRVILMLLVLRCQEESDPNKVQFGDRALCCWPMMTLEVTETLQNHPELGPVRRTRFRATVQDSARIAVRFLAAPSKRLCSSSLESVRMAVAKDRLQLQVGEMPSLPIPKMEVPRCH